MITQPISTLASHRDLLAAWTARTIRARYQQSVLGGLWAILQPLAAVLIFTVIFTVFIPINTGETPYVIFAFTAMVPWTLFSTSLVDMTESLVVNMGLVTKIYFPREILPIAALLARLLDAAIAGAALLILMVVYQQPLAWIGWLYLPLILGVQLAFTLGLGLGLAALNVFYRDVRNLVTLGLQLWFYATPIIYPVTTVPAAIRPFYYLNPMAGIVESYRSVLIYQQFPGTPLAIAAAISLATLVIGYWFFKRVEFQFADVV